MIANGLELQVTFERIQKFHEIIAHLRKVETDPINYRASVSGFLAEITRMQQEVHDYLSQLDFLS
jgi:hypothetical protein